MDLCPRACIPQSTATESRAPATCFTVPGEVCCLSNQVVVYPGGQFCPFMERVRQWLGRTSRVSVKGISRPECEKDTTSHRGPQPGLSADVECSVLSRAGFDLSHCAGDCIARNFPAPAKLGGGDSELRGTATVPKAMKGQPRN